MPASPITRCLCVYDIATTLRRTGRRLGLDVGKPPQTEAARGRVESRMPLVLRYCYCDCYAAYPSPASLQPALGDLTRASICMRGRIKQRIYRNTHGVSVEALTMAVLMLAHPLPSAAAAAALREGSAARPRPSSRGCPANHTSRLILADLAFILAVLACSASTSTSTLPALPSTCIHPRLPADLFLAHAAWRMQLDFLPTALLLLLHCGERCRRRPPLPPA